MKLELLARRQRLVRALTRAGDRGVASKLRDLAPLARARTQLCGSPNPTVITPQSTRSFSSSSSSTGFRCGECGASFVKWQGQCSSCNAWGSIAPAKSVASLYRQSNASSFSHAHKKTKHNSHAVPWAGGEDEDDIVLRTVLRMNEVQGEAVTERIKLPERELVRFVLVRWFVLLIRWPIANVWLSLDVVRTGCWAVASCQAR